MFQPVRENVRLEKPVERVTIAGDPK